MRKTGVAGLVAVLCWSGIVPAGWAQYNEIRYRRPAEQGPSSRVGVTGGLGTRDYGVQAQHLTRSNVGSATSGFSLGQSEQRRGRNPVPPVLLPAAFQIGRPGFAFRRTPSQVVFGGRNPYTLDRLREITGLKKSLSFDQPLLPRQVTFPELAPTPYYAPPDQRSEFDRVFDLYPSQPEPPPTEDKPLSLADLLERERQTYLAEKRKKALEAFKKGTMPRGEDRSEALARALALSENLMRSEPTDPIPALLTLHAALEKQSVLVAGRALLELVRRDPQIFIKKPDVKQYFGDPQVLDAQMRRYRRAAKLDPTNAVTYALQAYCNWMLDDVTGTRQALEAMEEVNRNTRRDPRIRSVRFALAAALR